MFLSEFHIQKNKDWNAWRLKPLSSEKRSEFHIQKNKDWNSDQTDTPAPAYHVWIPYPEKQGLKLNHEGNVKQTHERLNSISRKTRIETCICCIFWIPFSWVWIPYPEKQGLKPYSSFSSFFISSGLNSISRKTRIETSLYAHRQSSSKMVWIPYPEKQGLKRLSITLCCWW